jgi:hypothetical protein
MSSATGTHRERGNDSFRAGRYAEAEEHYTVALIDCAKDDRHLLHSNRAAARIGTGDFDGALVDAGECMRLDPTFAKGFYRAGQALEHLGRRAEAREVYRDGITTCAAPATRCLKKALSDASPAGGTEPQLEQLATRIEDWAEKGRVTVATRDFLPGETIMAEKPLLLWQGDPRSPLADFKNFLKAFVDASPPTQEAVMDMYHELSLVDDRDLAQVMRFAVSRLLQPDQIKILMATKATNAHDFGAEEHQGALFARGSLISHSCRPNANYSSHATPGKQRHTAIRPIAAGDEVTVSYGVGSGDKSTLWATSTPERRQHLLATKGFVCGCQRCTEPDLPQEHYDTIKRNREEMDMHAAHGQLRASIGDDRAAFDCTAKELTAAFTCIYAAECAAAGCGSQVSGCNHPAVFEMQKPAFHAGEAFAKIYAQIMAAPQFNGDGGILNEFHIAVEKYLPVVAQWLGTNDADFQSIHRAVRGWRGHAAFAPVVFASTLA